MRKLLLAAVLVLMALGTAAAIASLIPSATESAALPAESVPTGDRQPEVEMSLHPDLGIYGL
jgi:hypothetical protein